MNAVGVVVASLVMTFGFAAMWAPQQPTPCNINREAAHEVVASDGRYLTCDRGIA